MHAFHQLDQLVGQLLVALLGGRDDLFAALQVGQALFLDLGDLKGKKAKAGEEEESESEGDGAEGEGDDDEDDDEEENSISLAAMEAALLPQVLDTFDEISKTWKKITKVQEKRLTHLQRGEKIVPAT